MKNIRKIHTIHRKEEYQLRIIEYEYQNTTWLAIRIFRNDKPTKKSIYINFLDLKTFLYTLFRFIYHENLTEQNSGEDYYNEIWKEVEYLNQLDLCFETCDDRLIKLSSDGKLLYLKMLKPNENVYREIKKNSLALNMLEFRVLFQKLIERAQFPAIYHNNFFSYI